MPDLNILEEASRILQSDDCTMGLARTLLNDLMTKELQVHYNDSENNYLSTKSKLIKCKNFENGITDIQTHGKPSHCDKNAVKSFLKRKINNININNNDNDNQPTLSEKIRKHYKTLQYQTETQNEEYEDTSFISPTSCTVERLFSQAKIIRNSKRSSMTLQTFEAILYLKIKRRLLLI